MLSMNKVVGQSDTLEEDARPVVAELKPNFHGFEENGC